MKISKVGITNFLSWDNVAFELKDGLVCVLGDVKGNTATDSNGAGKTALVVESIAWCLYGKTIRGETGDAVVRNGSKGNASVCIEFEHEGANYKVCRYRKHKEFKNDLYFDRLDKKESTDLRGKSVAETEKSIVGVTKLPFTSFISSVVFAQDTVGRFTAMADSERKAVLDDLLAIDFNRYLVKAKATEAEVTVVLEGIEEEVKAVEKEKGIFGNVAGEAEGSLIDAETEYKKWIEFNTDIRKKLETRLNKLNKEKEKLTKEHKELDKNRSEIDSAMAGVDVDLNTMRNVFDQDVFPIREKQASVDALMFATEKEKPDTSEYDLVIQEFEIREKEIEKKIDALKEKEALPEGQECPTCLREIDHASVEHYERHIAEEIKELLQKLEEVNEEHNTAIKLKGSFVKDFFKDKEESIAHLVAQKGKHGAEEQALKEKFGKEREGLVSTKEDFYALGEDVDLLLEAKRKELEEAILEVREIETKLKATDESQVYEANIAKWKDMIKLNKDKETACAEKLEKLIKKFEAYNSVLPLADFWATAFGNQGIKSRLFDNIVEELSDTANVYLQRLSGGKMVVDFDTQTKLKSGEAREKFDVKVMKVDGSGRYKSCSGGEKRRADIAISLALQQLAAKSANPVNMVVFDEPFDGLDESGVEQAVELLNEIANGEGTTFVITHRPELKSYFDNAWTVNNIDGVSTLIK